MEKNKIVIVGGKLQGLEAAYLGMKAGIEIVLVDNNPNCIAKNLCSKFICGDILGNEPEILAEIDSADMVLPTMENDEVLEGLDSLSNKRGFILAFDWEAYKVSSSKLLSDKLFYDNQIPAPKYYPGGGNQYITKPIVGSGSHGVEYFKTRKDLESYIAKCGVKLCDINDKDISNNGNLIAQEYLSGPSYSIEVIGVPGNYRTYEVTKIHMDEVYDCRMVTSPCFITLEKKDSFSKMAIKLANIMQLKGIMDFEVIDCDDEFKLLEIDARIPSQTPTAVYHATGMNYVQELRNIFCERDFNTDFNEEIFFSSFEHIVVKDGVIKSEGEHVMTEGYPLYYIEGFCGADEAITDYKEGQSVWRATLINKANNLEDLHEKRKVMKIKIKELANKEEVLL